MRETLPTPDLQSLGKIKLMFSPWGVLGGVGGGGGGGQF